jgi:HAD superfamily hydrolase (TIGR01509 family)
LRVAGGRERIAHYMAQHIDGVSTNLVDDGLASHVHKLKNDHYAMLLKSGGIPLRPGILDLVQTAQSRDIRLAIATTTSRSNVGALINATAIGQMDKVFEVIATAENAVAKKPAPDIYQFVLARMELAPSDCLAVEDSQNGVRAAQSAGISVVATESLYFADDDLSGALIRIKALDQLPQSQPDMPLIDRMLELFDHAGAGIKL